MRSERVFLAFDTGRGLAYAQASGWQRTYLLWTFRNFRGVPHKILNSRQRKLVESLYSAGSTSLAGQLHEAVLIGTIEDFIPPSPAPASVSGRAGKAVSGISARESDDTLSRSLSEQLHAIHHRPVFPGLVRTVGAWALVAVMAVLSWQQLRSRPVVSASTPNPAVTSQASADDHWNKGQMNQGQMNQGQKDQTRDLRPATAPTLPNPDTQPPTLAKVASASPITVASFPASQSSLLSSVTQNVPREVTHKHDANQTAAGVPRVVADLGSMHNTSLAPPRMRISGPPRKLVYPVCPDGNTRGKVSLRAVVGYDGTVNQVKVLAGNRLLGAAAARAIREWRYQPFSEDAEKVERETRITVSFISNDVVAVSFPDAAPVSR